MHKNIQKISKFGTIFENDTHTCKYCRYKRPKICPALCKMHQLYIKYTLLFIFINMIFSDCFQSFPLSFSFSAYYFCSFFSIQSSSFSRISTISFFKTFSNINNRRRYSHFKIILGAFCLYNTAN